MNETHELFDYLKYGGFQFWMNKRGRLIVLPDEWLTPALRLAIERHRGGLTGLALGCDRRCTDCWPRIRVKPKPAEGISLDLFDRRKPAPD
jgi:hypothetical protein